jgi:hypothetical protein
VLSILLSRVLLLVKNHEVGLPLEQLLDDVHVHDGRQGGRPDRADTLISPSPRFPTTPTPNPNQFKSAAIVGGHLSPYCQIAFNEYEAKS